MRKSILAFTLITSFVLAFPVYAEESTSLSGPNQTIKQNTQQVQTEITEEQKIKTQGIHSKFNVSRTAARAIMLSKKYAFISNRFNNIISRFETRINILVKAGKQSELVNVSAKLAEAQKQLVLANTASVNVMNAFSAISTISTKGDFTNLQILIKTANGEYKKVNTLLKVALKELKAISKPALPASSSAVNNSI